VTTPAESGQGRTVTALFSDRKGGECGYRSAVELGYEASDLTLVMSDATRQRYFPDTGPTDTALGTRANEGAGKPAEGSELGGPLGGTLATLTPAAAAVGTVLLIPGIIFAGPVAIALAAAGAAGLAGGLMGALATWGVPSDRVEKYEAHIRQGGILMGLKVRTAADADALERQWLTCGGRRIDS
jgi:hypothetical protein